jgi:CubicO group peptidase (beta-lactamase class C family)
MSKMRSIFLSLLVMTGLAQVLHLSVKHASARSTRSKSIDSIDAYIEGEMHRLSIPGASLAIIEKNQIVHMHGFGKAHPGGIAPTSQTPFYIGSLTKSFTALAVMQLVEAGKIELDCPVQSYLPWFKVADQKASACMTVRHLLNQTSGIPGSVGDIDLANFDALPGAAKRQALALASLQLSHPVGSVCEYSNTNYNLLGLVVEAASGETYSDYIQSHIIQPLDMTHTCTSRGVAKRNGLAMGHQYWFGMPFEAPDLPVPHGSLPSGWLISSAEDMSHYLIAHLNGGHYGEVEVLSEKGMTELHRGAVEYSKMGISAGTYAMGWFDGKIGDTRIVWHSGIVPNFCAFMAILPGQEKGFVFLYNASHWWYNPVSIEFGMKLSALLAGEKPPATPFFAMTPWILRAQLLLPVFQISDVAATMKLLRRWKLDPGSRPIGRRKWGQYILLPFVMNLLTALTLKPIHGKKRGFLKLYMPDFSRLAAISGSFALPWSILRTGLIQRSLRGSSVPQAKKEKSIATEDFTTG